PLRCVCGAFLELEVWPGAPYLREGHLRLSHPDGQAPLPPLPLEHCFAVLTGGNQRVDSRPAAGEHVKIEILDPLMSMIDSARCWRGSVKLLPIHAPRPQVIDPPCQ